MFEKLDMSRTVSKEEYKAARKSLVPRLIALQRRLLEARIPVIVVFEGMSAAGKGTLINELIVPLDPRGFNVYNMTPSSEEERLRPFLWRYWTKTPARGRIAVFDRSWYRRVTLDRLDREVKRKEVPAACQDIVSFERQLADDGNVILKFFLHISKAEQKRRFKKLAARRNTAWRVTKEDWRRHRQYDKYLSAVEEMFSLTDSDFAPWTILEAHDQRFATLKMLRCVAETLEKRLESAAKATKAKSASKPDAPAQETLNVSLLDPVDLTQSLDEKRYDAKLKEKQRRLRDLEHEIYMRRIPVIVVYEGWDAAGKGGNIRRVTENLDPRGYEVVPIAAPTDVEKSHHYLWRFWTQIPKAGHITIFDRSWYGRVMVERVEGFCSAGEWRRAYREINEMELHLTHFGAVLVKFWLHIDPAEQLRRFRRRERIAYKRWKITEEDWRNRAKWDAYKEAVEEMLFRTSSPNAPWTIVESNDKRFARVKTLDTIITAIEEKL